MGRALPFGVNLVAYIRAEMGLGAAARGMAQALESAAIPFNILNFEHGNPSLHRDQSWSHKEVVSSSYEFTILAVNPDNISNAKELVHKRNVIDRCTIGCWSWELPEIPDSWLSAFALVNEVWVPSRFVQDAISAKSSVPIFRVPHAICLRPSNKFSRESFHLPARQFLFLTMGDTQSQLTRKNPLGTIRAFKKAFPREDESAGLVVKINNVKTRHDDQETLDLLKAEIEGYKNIYLLETGMPRAKIDSLLAVSDCFVSLHRSEGFGLGPAEAMSLGKPVILTNWSGNTDYMTPANSIGIDYELIPVGKQYGPYAPDQLWADPDLGRAAYWMKRLVKDPALAQKIGRLGQETIKKEFSPQAVGQIIQKRLTYASGGAPPPLQVFVPREGNYHESFSRVREFRPKAWQCVKVVLEQGLGDVSAPLRFDPGNKTGIVDLAAVSLRSATTRKVVWRLKTRPELETLKIGGTAMLLADDRLLRLASFGEDPQVFLPPLSGPEFDGPLILEAWIRLNTSPPVIIEALAKDSALREAARASDRETARREEQLQIQLDVQKTQLDAQKSELARQGIELEAQKRDYAVAAEQLLTRETEIGQLRGSVLDREQENARLSDTIASLEKKQEQLVKEANDRGQALALVEQDLSLLKSRFEALKRERGELLRERGEQTRLLSRLEQDTVSQKRELAQLRDQILEVASQLAHDRRAMWNARVRRADATARLLQREQELRRIKRSLPWKTVKPLWKLGRFFAAEETPPAARQIAFAIDSPADWNDISEKVVISGWCFHPTGEQIAGVRARIGGKTHIGHYGFERNDVAGIIGHGSVARHSGFTIECKIPAEPSTIVIETIVQGEEWKAFFERELKRPAPGQRRVASQKAGPARKPDGVADFEAARKQLTALFEGSARTEASRSPRFSVITPTFNTKARWLVDAAQSLVSQTMPDWEWCIVDDGSTNADTPRLLKELAALDPRVRVELKENAGISAATNRAVSLARGELVCFMDHDDWLAPEAFALVSRKVDAGFDVVYSDEDKYDEATGRFGEAFYKPDWSPEYLRSVMYVGHLLTVRRNLAQQVAFDSNFDGVQDFEFMLRVGETGAAIGHVPQILYHWRKVPGSIAAESGAKAGIDLLQKKAVDAHLARLGLPGETDVRGGHRLRTVPHPKEHPPTIGIIIPTKDAPELIGRCLESLHRVTTYPNYDVVVMDNGTTDPAALEAMSRYPIKRIKSDGEFNFSRANNMGSEHTSAPYLVFLNNDTEIVAPDWLQHLLYHAEQPDVGAAGPLLLYPNRTVQHAGVALGMRGTADHVMRGFPAEVDGYAGSLACAREVSAVTAACLMMSRRRFEEIGRFSELFSTLYQDVDLCLRLRARQLRIVYTPEAVLIHHESASRKSYYDIVDRMFLLDQWDALIEKGDPYYNRNLNLERGDYSSAARG